MTDKEFQQVDEKFAFTAYVILFGVFLFGADHLSLRLANDLTEWGRVAGPVIIFSGFSLFAIIQSLRVVAYYRRYGKGLR